MSGFFSFYAYLCYAIDDFLISYSTRLANNLIWQKIPGR